MVGSLVRLLIPLDLEAGDSLQLSEAGGGGLCQQLLGFRKGLTIASLNLNGLCGHFNEVELLLYSLGIHFLALNETKIE